MATLEKKIKMLRFLKRFQYIIFFTVCAGILLVQIASCFAKYLEEPSYISSFIADQQRAEFPEITLCSEGGGYKSNILLENGFLSSSDYSATGNHTWHSTNTTVTPQELFESATFSAEDMIEKMLVRTVRGDTEHKYSFNPQIGITSKDFIWSQQYHRGFGRCHSVYPGPKIKNLGVYYAKITGKVDLKIYLHHRGQFLDLSGRMGMKIYTNTSIQMQVSWLHVEMLDEHTKTVQKGFKCSGIVEYDQCIYNILTKKMKEVTSTGCTVPYVPENTNICRKESDRDLAFQTHYDRITNQAGDCPNPCEFLLLSLGGQNRALTSDNKSQVYFYFQSRTVVNEESLLYTPLSLFAEIGGYVGLLLGFSIFHVADLISSLLDRKLKKYEEQLTQSIPQMESMMSIINTQK